MPIWAWIFLGIIIVISVGLFLLYRFTTLAQQPRVFRNDRKPPVPYENVQWESDGYKIKGWLLRQMRTKVGPAMIIAHGFGSNRARVLRYALPLYKEGYFVLMYDARCHGDSEKYKSPSGFLFRDDLIVAVQWLKKRAEIDADRIGILGHSLGAFGAVLALDEGLKVRAIVTDSMPVRLSTMICAELRRRRIPTFPLSQIIQLMMSWHKDISRKMLIRADPVRIMAENAKKAKVPVLHVHSKRDYFIPPSELNLIVRETPDSNYLYVNSYGHSASERDPAFWPTVNRFLQESLQEKPDPAPN